WRTRAAGANDEVSVGRARVDSAGRASLVKLIFRGVRRVGPSPDMEMLPAVIVIGPAAPLVRLELSILAPPVICRLGVVTVMAPAVPKVPPKVPKEFVNNP